MKTFAAQKPKPRYDGSFEDLYEDNFNAMKWNPGILKRAMPKEGAKIRKMKSR